jgi:adenine-specific DNA-methyltransferase
VSKTLHLSEREKEQIKALIDAGQPLPPRYRAVLFADPPEAELIWPGKTNEVTNVVLPFQTIEQIDEPRAEAGAHHVADLFAFDATTGRQSGGWTNKLIWGDNKLVLAALKNGPLRKQIEHAGGLKLVYIDPPFDVGADFSFDIEVGDNERLTKEPSVIEDVAYRDTWGRGADSYAGMLYERVKLIYDLLCADGSFYIHCDWRVNGLIRSILDEVFSTGAFHGEIIWKRTTSHSDARSYGSVHDTIFFYTKGEFTGINPVHQEYDTEYLEQYYRYKDEHGRRFMSADLSGAGPGPARRFGDKIIEPPPGRHWMYDQAGIDRAIAEDRIFWTRNGVPRLKKFIGEDQGMRATDLWADIQPLRSWHKDEDTSYATQKPEALLDRIVRASSNEEDLVADFFCGSGTTMAVAEKLGRKWIGCDLGRFAVHVSRKRLIGMQRELKAAGKPYRSFEILNLGKYERQYFAGIDPTLPEEQRRVLSIQKEEQYLTLILSAYKAERILQTPPFHGRKGGGLVLVGPVDAPITWSDVNQAIETCQRMRVSRCDLLGFEFEMGLSPHAHDDARSKGVSLALRYIPKDVFDKRAVEKGQVVFYDVAYVEVQPIVKGRTVQVKLTDFGVYYRQEDVDALVASLKNGGSKVTVEAGKVVKITKDKNGVVSRDVLTKAWTDWIDYWAVDFDFESRPETIRIMMPDASGELRERTQWTGGYIFENEWQSFRTRRNRSLELESAAHEYPNKGRYKIAVKVIDIFGNDTTKIVGVTV